LIRKRARQSAVPSQENRQEHIVRTHIHTATDYKTTRKRVVDEWKPKERTTKRMIRLVAEPELKYEILEKQA